MKRYVGVCHVSYDHITNRNDLFKNEVLKWIEECHKKGCEVEVQYQVCATSDTVVYSALILPYVNE